MSFDIANQINVDRILKTVDPWFQLLWNNRKTFELRKLDRDFQIGQEWYLWDFDANKGVFNNRLIRIKITHILMPEEFPDALKPGYGIISFIKLESIVLQKSNIMDEEKSEIDKVIKDIHRFYPS